MLRKLFAFIVVFALVTLPLSSLAQTEVDDPPCGGPFGEPCIPIDGGLSFLIAAGVAYGGKKAFDVYKKQ